MIVALAVVALLAVGGSAALAWLWRKTARERDVEASRADRIASEADGRVRQTVRRAVEREESRLRKEHGRAKSDLRHRESEVKARRKRLAERRARLEERAAALDARAEELAERAGDLDRRAAELDERERAQEQVEQQARQRLEQIADLSSERARQQLLSEVEHEIGGEVARAIQKADRSARATVDQAAKDLLLSSMSALRTGSAREGTVSVVRLPNEEMKGRIIGREGRNIRALEHALGVDLMVDDTPGAILLSCWDPLRRTIAVRALETLIEDGRIHPARIEDVVAKTREVVDDESRARGEEAAFEVGAIGVHERLVLLLGRLSYATDHGQSLLRRAVEVGLLAGVIGDELAADGDSLRRAGLLHEIARADSMTLRSHAALAGADLASRFGEPPAVTDPIRALAQPPDAPRTPQGVILTTARRFALARPGARNDNLQRHMDRLREIESVALAHEGIESAVAVRAGRELRVHLRSTAFGDEQSRRMARTLAREIEKKIDYPGAIRVIVIRETRAVSYAV